MVCLFTAITKQGVLFLWPCKLPSSDGRSDSWANTALAAAQRAESRWVRVSANMSASGYDTFEAIGELSEPVWPEESFPDILRIAFKDRFIQDFSHPVLRSLRGEI